MTAASLPLLLDVVSFAKQRSLLENVLLVDVSSPGRYHDGHVPGALHLPPSALLCGTPPAPGKIPQLEQLQHIFGQLGLTPAHHVVAYDDEGGGWAARLLWTLEVMGHHSYSYLNGGIHAWHSAGFDTETTVNQAKPSNYQVQLHSDALAEVADILPRLQDANFRIWDARSAEEYQGTRSGSARAGHIPGAINIDWLELIDRNNATRLVDLKKLQQRLNTLGLSADKDIVTHCQSHHRSSLSWLVMKILGYPSAKGYHGSWGEWGNRNDTPVEI